MCNAKFFTYILLTERNTFYCGYTNDLKKRFELHKSGHGARYTRVFKPVKIVYFAEFETKSEAMKEEYRIKHLERYEKELLVKNFDSAKLSRFGLQELNI